MDIDLSILRTLEREKEISFDVLIEAIEQALSFGIGIRCHPANLYRRRYIDGKQVPRAIRRL